MQSCLAMAVWAATAGLVSRNAPLSCHALMIAYLFLAAASATCNNLTITWHLLVRAGLY